MGISTIVTNVLTTASVLLLLGRHPNRRLRYLVLTVGLVSVSQTASYILQTQSDELSRALVAVQQFVTAIACMGSIYILWREISDRNRTDRMLRLAEHENQVMQSRLERTAPYRTGEHPAHPGAVQRSA